jgi:hypothetical protein
LTILLKFGSRAALKKLRNLNLSLSLSPSLSLNLILSLRREP